MQYLLFYVPSLFIISGRGFADIYGKIKAGIVNCDRVGYFEVILLRHFVFEINLIVSRKVYIKLSIDCRSGRRVRVFDVGAGMGTIGIVLASVLEEDVEVI